MSYISLFNQNEVTGDIISNNIIIGGNIDFTNANIIGLVDNITTALINNNSQIQVKDGGITDIKIVSMSATKLSGYISISGSVIYFTLPLDMSNNNINNINTLTVHYIILNGTDLDTRITLDELEISNLKSQMITANNNIYTLQLKTQYLNTFGQLTNNLLPNANNTIDIGSLTYNYNNGYFNKIYTPTINYSSGIDLQYNGNSVLNINSDGFTMNNASVNKIYCYPGSNLQLGMNSGNTYFYSDIGLNAHQLLNCSFGSINTVSTNYIDYNVGSTPITIGGLTPSIIFGSSINVNNKAITNCNSITSGTTMNINSGGAYAINLLTTGAQITTNSTLNMLNNAITYCNLLSGSSTGLQIDGNSFDIQFNNNIIPNANHILSLGSSSKGFLKIYGDELSATNGGLSLNGNGISILLKSNLLPNVNNTFSLGTAGQAYSNIYTVDLNLNGSSLSTALTALQNKTQYQSASSNITTFTGSINCPTYTAPTNTNINVTAAGSGTINFNTGGTIINAHSNIDTLGNGIYNCNALSGPSNTNIVISALGSGLISLSTAGTSISTNTQINMNNNGIFNCASLTGQSGYGLLLDGNGSNIINNSDMVPATNNTQSIGTSSNAMKNVYCNTVKSGTGSGLTLDGSGNNIVTKSSILPDVTTSYTLGSSSYLFNGIFSAQDMISYESNTFPVLAMTSGTDVAMSFPVTATTGITSSSFSINTSTGSFTYNGSATRKFQFSITAGVSATVNNTTYIFRLRNVTQSVDLITRSAFSSSGTIYGLSAISGIMILNNGDTCTLYCRTNSSTNFTFYNIHVSGYSLLN